MTRLASHAVRHPARALALAIGLASALPAFAAPSPADGASPAAIRPLVGVMVTGTLSSDQVEVRNPDGSMATGSLGGRYEAYAGAEFPVDPNGLTLRLTAGVHATSSLSNSGGGSEHMTSFPLEATLWYPVNDRLRIGGGVRYAMRSRFSGAGERTGDGLNPAPGALFGVGYRVMPHLELDLRYVYERYELAGSGDLDASHWGLGLMALY